MTTTNKSRQLFKKAMPRLAALCSENGLPFSWKGGKTSYFEFASMYLHTDGDGVDSVWIEKGESWERFQDLTSLMSFAKRNVA